MDFDSRTPEHVGKVVTPQLVGPATAPQARRRRSGLGRGLFVLLLLALTFSVLLNVGLLGMSQSPFSPAAANVEESYHSLSRTAHQKVAVITVAGVIMDGNGFVKNQIDRVREDENGPAGNVAEPVLASRREC